MEILKAESISKSYEETGGRLSVLKDINLTLKEGQSIAITGESGSGKSTLMHILGSLDSADRGNIYYISKERKPLEKTSNVYYKNSFIDIKGKKINNLRNSLIGFVFQFHYLLEDFSCVENVAMPMFLKTKNLSKSKKKAREILEVLGLKGKENSYPNQLSGGQAQRVAVARAIINRPRTLLLDEPTGNLDKKHSDSLVDILFSLKKDFSQSFIIVSHNREIAKKMDISYLLEEGILK